MIDPADPSDSHGDESADLAAEAPLQPRHFPPIPRARRNATVAITLLILATVIMRGAFMFWSPNKVERRDDGRLSPCPTSPNCVCSHEGDAVHRIGPLKFSDSPHEAFQRLIALVTRQPRTRVITHDEPYLHVEFMTPLLRFVDDVEFLLDDSAKVIHVRSASRVGHSDLGANRKRVEAIRRLFES